MDIFVIVEYCNSTNLDVCVTVKRKSEAGTIVETCVPFEKFVDSDVKLRVRFVPAQTGEHTISIRENGKLIEGFPVKVSVFNNKEPYVLCESLYGVKLGTLAKLSVVFSEPVDTLNVKVTSIALGFFHNIVA